MSYRDSYSLFPRSHSYCAANEQRVGSYLRTLMCRCVKYVGVKCRGRGSSAIFCRGLMVGRPYCWQTGGVPARTTGSAGGTAGRSSWRLDDASGVRAAEGVRR
ncbi:hypothetical protein evm_014487 [Chilo suppressalis]|nr:hypothetical protein evm_014487 [Chilo suppressalis]